MMGRQPDTGLNLKKYKRIGKCKRCGKCCSIKDIIGDRDDVFVRAIQILMMGKEGKCPHLSRIRDGRARCKIYKERPWFCQQFPAEPDDIAGIPDCGYSFVEVKGDE
jgi:Fe-S-cluster containining protein